MVFRPGGKGHEARAAMAKARAASKEKRRKGQHRTNMTLSVYNGLVPLFRELGPRFSEVGRRAGIAPGTAKKAWYSGWPHLALPPINDVVTDERRDARVKLAQLEAQRKAEQDEQERLKAAEYAQLLREQVVDARAEEGLMVATLRRDTVDMGRAVGDLIGSARKLVTRITTMLDDPNTPVTLTEAVSIIQRLSHAISTLSSAGLNVQKMDRDLLGTGEGTRSAEELIVHGQVEDLDVLVAESEQFSELLQRARDRTKARLLGSGEGARADAGRTDDEDVEVEAELVGDAG